MSSARLSCSVASTKAERLRRSLPGFPPQRRSSFDIARLRAVTGQHFGPVLGDLAELALEGFGDLGMKVASRLAQQQAVGRILHEGVFEEIGCIGRHALAEQQPRPNEPFELHFQLRLWPGSHREQELMREFAADRRSDLGKFLGAAESVEPRHQRCVQACRHGHRRRGNRGRRSAGPRPRTRSRARLSSSLPRTTEFRPFAR